MKYCEMWLSTFKFISYAKSKDGQNLECYIIFTKDAKFTGVSKVIICQYVSLEIPLMLWFHLIIKLTTIQKEH